MARPAEDHGGGDHAALAGTIAESGPRAGRSPSPALVYGLTFTGMIATTLVSPIIPEILDDLGAQRSQAGVLVAASTVPAIAMAPVIGMVADRLGRRAVLMPCLAALVVFGLAGALAPTYPALLVIRVLQGLAAAGLVNMAVVLVADHWQGSDRARVLGRNAAVLTGSIAVVPLLAGAIASVGGWRWAFALYGVAGLSVFAVARADLDGHTPPAPERSSLWSDLHDTMALLGHPLLRRPLLLGVVTMSLVFGWTVTLTPLHAEEVLGLGAGLRGALVAVSAVAATAVALASRILSVRLGASLVTVAGFCSFALAYALMGAASSTTAAVVVGLVLAGCAQGAMVPVLQAAMAAAAPASRRAAAMSLWGSAVRSGQTLGPLAVGALLGIGGARLYGIGALTACTVLLAVVASRSGSVGPAPRGR